MPTLNEADRPTDFLSLPSGGRKAGRSDAKSLRPELSIYLDVARIVAAGLVFIQHANNFTSGIFSVIGGHGRGAVAIFFVLSGFVISYVATTREQTLSAYTTARAVRIYSVAIIALIVTPIVDVIGLSLKPALYLGKSYFDTHSLWHELLFSLIFAGEFWNQHIFPGSDEPYWSVSFEVWYYVLFAAMTFSKSRWSLIIVPVLLAIIGPKMGVYFLLWLLGSFAYWTIRHFPSRTTRSWRGFLYGSALIFVAPLMYVLTKHLIPSDRDIYSSFSWTLVNLRGWTYFASFGVGFVSTLLGVDTLAPFLTKAAAFINRPVKWLAGGTFTLYLVHQPILLCMAAIFDPLDRAIRGPLIITATLLLSYLLAEVGERRKHLWRRAGIRLFGFAARGQLS